jgi:hypothetical protein
LKFSESYDDNPNDVESDIDDDIEENLLMRKFGKPFSL